MSSNANKERENDQVAVSTMKASRFYAAFKGSIDKWEHILSHISKVIEVLLTVQRQWMYLESIFMASEDIRKQLPTEAIIFEDMNNKFKNVMSAVHKDPNAERSCTEKGRLEIVVDMDNQLQEIQKVS
jgi:dynein heavy chain